MNAENATTAIASGSNLLTAAQAAIKRRRIILDLAIIALLVFGLTVLVLFNPFEVNRQRTVGVVLGSTVLVFLPTLLVSWLEQVLPTGGPRKSLQKWLLHVQIMIANYATEIPFNALAFYLGAALVQYFHIRLGLIDLRLASDSGHGLLVLAGAFFLSLFVSDFFFYWYHRALHKSVILWQHHKMHHMDREYDALTGQRQNWLENLFLSFVVSIPLMIFFKFDKYDPFGQGLSIGILIGAIQFLTDVNHSNLRLQYGKASFLFMSYQYHRIHHSCLPQHQDKNFVAYFPLWDILFGTYHAPAWHEFPPTGVDGEKEIESFWESQIFAPREWWKMFRAWRRRRALTLLSD